MTMMKRINTVLKMKRKLPPHTARYNFAYERSVGHEI